MPLNVNASIGGNSTLAVSSSSLHITLAQSKILNLNAKKTGIYTSSAAMPNELCGRGEYDRTKTGWSNTGKLDLEDL